MARQERWVPAGQPVQSPLATGIALQRLGVGRDPEAWQSILETHGPAVLNLARRMTGDAALAEDVCQETWLQIRTDAKRFRPVKAPGGTEAAARGWIMRIACHTASRMLRKRAANRRREEQVREAMAQRAPSAGEVVLTREQSEIVRQEVAALDESLREAVCLHFYSEQPYAELAGQLACSVEAVKKRVQRGLDRLRSRLARRGLMIGLAALSAQLLQGTADAAEGLAVKTVVLDAQRQAVWQALLNSSQQPAYSFAAHMGGTLIVSKITLISASAIVLFLASASSYYVGELRNKDTHVQTVALQEDVRRLQQQLADARQELTTMHSELADRQDSHRKVSEQVDALTHQLDNLKADHENIVTQAAGPGAMIAGPMPPEVDEMVKKLIAGAVAKTGEKDEAADKPENQHSAINDGDVTVQHFTLTGGGEGQVMIMKQVIGLDGNLKLEKTADGKAVQRLDIGGDQHEIVIQLNGGQEQPKTQPPPKAREEF